MLSRIALGAAVTAAVLGGGGVALAATSPSSGSLDPAHLTAATSSTSSAAKHGTHRHARLAPRRLEHAVIVTKGKDGAVTHDLIRGDVTSVSATSISVRADDGVSMTFTVSSDTKVRARTDGKGSASSIGAVKTGDTALVTGTGTTTLTARHVLDLGTKTK